MFRGSRRARTFFPDVCVLIFGLMRALEYQGNLGVRIDDHRVAFSHGVFCVAGGKGGIFEHFGWHGSQSKGGQNFRIANFRGRLVYIARWCVKRTAGHHTLLYTSREEMQSCRLG